MYDAFSSESLPNDIPIIVEDDINEIYGWFQNNGSVPLIAFIDHEMKVYHIENESIPSFESTNVIINEMLINLEEFLDNLSIFSNTQYPSGFNLHPSYPNPFNPVLNINFDISWAGLVQVNIIDISGAHIENLHSGYLPSGSHKLSWNAESMPSGLYMVSLKSGDESLTEKVVLLK